MKGDEKSRPTRRNELTEYSEPRDQVIPDTGATLPTERTTIPG